MAIFEVRYESAIDADGRTKAFENVFVPLKVCVPFNFGILDDSAVSDMELFGRDMEDDIVKLCVVIDGALIFPVGESVI